MYFFVFKHSGMPAPCFGPPKLFVRAVSLSKIALITSN